MRPAGLACAFGGDRRYPAHPQGRKTHQRPGNERDGP